MTLEQALIENTAAVKALTVALSAQGEAPKGRKTAAKTETPAAVAENAPAPGATPAPSQTAGTPAQSASEPAAAPSKETMTAIAAEVTKLANSQGRDAVVATLAKFGATKIPEVVAAGKADALLAYVKSLNNPTAGAQDFM